MNIEWYEWKGWGQPFLVIKMNDQYYSIRSVTLFKNRRKSASKRGPEYRFIVREPSVTGDTVLQDGLTTTYARESIEKLIQKNMDRINDPFAWEDWTDVKALNLDKEN